MTKKSNRSCLREPVERGKRIWVCLLRSLRENATRKVKKADESERPCRKVDCLLLAVRCASFTVNANKLSESVRRYMVYFGAQIKIFKCICVVNLPKVTPKLATQLLNTPESVRPI